MDGQALSYKNSSIHWYRFGTGTQPVVCFHGYGEEGKSFEFLGERAGSQFSFYAIDLPFHGETNWNEGRNFSHHDLLAIITEIVRFENRIIVMGFSLGGRIALSLFQSNPQHFDKVVLLAPDGLKMNGWYWLATQTWLGNKFFSFTMKRPGWFFGFLKLMNKLGLVNASIFKFVNYYIGDKKVRQLLYDRWTTLRRLKPNLKKIKSMVIKHQVAVRLVYGRHDRIILSSVGEKFRKGIEETCEVIVIDSGHQILHENHAADLISSLQH